MKRGGPLKRKTGLKPGTFNRPSNKTCPKIGLRPKRARRLRAKSLTNSNRHVNLKFREEYMAANPMCEMRTVFPKWGGFHWLYLRSGVSHPLRNDTASTDPHHILWGQARRHDIRANLLAICREAHDFCHKFKVDGMVLALEAKRRKGELDFAELDRISRMSVKGWLSTKRCTFPWCEEIRIKLVKGEES